MARRPNGFTLVEVAVVVPILMMSILALFGTLYAMLRTSAIEQTNTTAMYGAQAALDVIERDGYLAIQFLPTIDTGITDHFTPASNGGTWSYVGDTATSQNRVLIMRMYATVGHPESSERKLAYLAAGGCTLPNMYLNDVLTYNILYFVEDGTLYRRKALNTTALTCETMYQKQTCPASTSHASCQAEDEVIATGVSAFSVKYYGSLNSSSSLNVYSVGSDPEMVRSARAIEMTLTLRRRVYSMTIERSSKLRFSRANVTGVADGTP